MLGSWESGLVGTKGVPRLGSAVRVLGGSIAVGDGGNRLDGTGVCMMGPGFRRPVGSGDGLAVAVESIASLGD